MQFEIGIPTSLRWICTFQMPKFDHLLNRTVVVAIVRVEDTTLARKRD
jgi:hypothetical protein